VKTVLASKWYRQAPIVHCYHAIGSEVQTRSFFEYAFDDDKIVLLPVINPAIAVSLVHAHITPRTQYIYNKQGLPTPITAEKMHSVAREICTATTCIIVPMVGFDDKLYRLGYGKGYYDAFLSGIPSKKIGIAFQSQIITEIPCELHDVPLDMVITETMRCCFYRIMMVLVTF
jgi:5-formyltetrahydrofolate cyclo-ligase